MTKVMMSIKPEHVENIFKLTKRYEYRKTKCKLDVDEIVIYCAAPVSKVVGTARIRKVLEGTPEEIWEQTKDRSASTYEAFMEYFTGREHAVAYQLGVITQFAKHQELKEYKIWNVPQSYIYLDDQGKRLHKKNKRKR